MEQNEERNGKTLRDSGKNSQHEMDPKHVHRQSQAQEE